VGNHEFDAGVDEPLRMRYGNRRGGDGCHPVDGWQEGTPFGGSIFEYLAANVFFATTNRTILPPYEARKVGNAKIALIGRTFEGTPTVVDVIADAMLEATTPTDFGGAVAALMNSGGVRAGLLSTKSAAASRRAR
jgi:5'-nucleotidase